MINAAANYAAATPFGRKVWDSMVGGGNYDNAWLMQQLGLGAPEQTQEQAPVQPQTQPDIGMELTGQGPSEDRSRGAFSQFLHDPKNIATMLLFGASLTQPNRPGLNGMQSAVQSAVGAAAFRGALEAGMEKRKLEREETAFERAAKNRELELQGRQVSAQERNAATAAQEVTNRRMADFEQRQATHEENAANRALELQLQQMRDAPTEKDLIGIAMQSVPYLLDTMEFEPGMSPQQKMALAQNEAIKGTLMFQSLLRSGAQIVRGQDGRMYVDDGRGNDVTPRVGPNGAAAPTTSTAPPTAAPPPSGPGAQARADRANVEAAQARVAQMDQQQRQSPFVRSIEDRGARMSAGSDALIAMARESSHQAAVFNTAQRVKRAMHLGAQFRRDDIALLAQADDAALAKAGMSEQEIFGVRRLAEQLNGTNTP